MPLRVTSVTRPAVKACLPGEEDLDADLLLLVQEARLGCMHHCQGCQVLVAHCGRFWCEGMAQVACTAPPVSLALAIAAGHKVLTKPH